MKEGMVIAIEPMINLGVKQVWYDDDGWTVRTKDGKPSGALRTHDLRAKEKADVLSSFEHIEINEKANANLDSSYY
jgi:methionyl aminopeptidase